MPKAMVNGININYRVQGKGEPLVLIMGADMDQSGWIFQTRAFKKYYRVITFDNRGVGKTDKPSGAYSMKMMADDTVSLMDHLGIKKAHILGVSMGGAIAQVIAINYPERINKLILGCTYAGSDESSGPTPEILKIRGIMDASYTFNSKLLIIILNLIMKIQLRFMDTTGVLGHGEAAKGYNILDNLHTIRVPTLVITGTKDRAIKPSSSEVMAKLIPNAKLVKVEGGSHAFFFEMRGRFNKEVLDFLKSG